MTYIQYDIHFDENEKRQITRLRQLDGRRLQYAWSIAIVVIAIVFLSQVVFRGVSWVHALATYGCMPLGLAVGWYVNRRINIYIENQFVNKWDPLYYERAGTTPALEAARSEILRVTDEPSFYGLSEEEQMAAMAKINRKYGL